MDNLNQLQVLVNSYILAHILSSATMIWNRQWQIGAGELTSAVLYSTIDGLLQLSDLEKGLFEIGKQLAPITL